MNCENFQQLSTQEKIEFIGKLNHAAMSNDHLFTACTKIIEVAEENGVFEGVTIMPSSLELVDVI
jgi:hypothetical protein